MHKIQEDADLQLANDLMGTTESTVEEGECHWVSQGPVVVGFLLKLSLLLFFNF